MIAHSRLSLFQYRSAVSAAKKYPLSLHQSMPICQRFITHPHSAILNLRPYLRTVPPVCPDVRALAIPDLLLPGQRRRSWPHSIPACRGSGRLPGNRARPTAAFRQILPAAYREVLLGYAESVGGFFHDSQSFAGIGRTLFSPLK